MDVLGIREAFFSCLVTGTDAVTDKKKRGGFAPIKQTSATAV